MAEQSPVISTSLWDGRQQFFDLWYEEVNGIRTSIICGEYETAMEYLSSFHVKISDKVELDLISQRDETNRLLEQIHRSRYYNDEANERRARVLENRLKNHLVNWELKLTDTMRRLKMLTPFSERYVMDEPESIADAYEQGIYGDLSPGKQKYVPEMYSYLQTYPYLDEKTRHVLMRQAWLARNQDKDGLIIIFGAVSGGKTTIANHLHDLYTWGHPLVKRVAFDRPDFANVIRFSLAQEELQERVTHYDEANVSRREHATNWNKDLIDLYDSIRGKNGLHLWCNPSAQHLEQKFISERVAALIYVRGGTGNRRYFDIIPRLKVLALLEKKGNLKFETMENFAADYSIHTGWFNDYPDNEFRKSYLKKKEERMSLKLQLFMEKHGSASAEEETANDSLSMNQAISMLRTSPKTLRSIVKFAFERGQLNEAEIKDGLGHYKFAPHHVEILKRLVAERPKTPEGRKGVAYYELRHPEESEEPNEPEQEEGEHGLIEPDSQLPNAE